MKRITLHHLQKLKAKGEKITCLTAYDASFAQVLDQAGIEVLLIGDSLGMVVQGHDSTLPVSIENMIYHSQLVARGSQRAFLIADMPFMSYATSKQAVDNATRLMQLGQVHMVKLEGGSWLAETIQQLTQHGIPVCGHLGLTPQSVHQLGGYHVQGRSVTAAEQLRHDALALQAAGVSLLVLECIPRQLAANLTQELSIPTIGIGAGADCGGQVLVLYDLLGIAREKIPSFAKNFLQETDSIENAVIYFIKAVKDGSFPSEEYSFA